MNKHIKHTGDTRRRTARRAGSVVTVVALSMTVLLGFCAMAVDYGTLIVTKNHLQRACDAAALAGAQELPLNAPNALAQAQTTVQGNGVKLAEATVTFPAGAQQIRVTAVRQVKFLFAGALGIFSSNVGASALAGRSAPLRGVDYAVPLAITTNDYFSYQNGTPFEVRLVDNNRQDFTPSTVTSLDLRPDSSGKSGAVFQEDLTNGYNGTIFIDQKIDNALNADLTSQGNKLVIAFRDRIQEAASASYHDNGSSYTFPNYPPEDSRIITIIVADPNPLSNNNPTLAARWFVPVYIDSYKTQGKETYITFRILPTRTVSATDPNIVVGDSTTVNTGITAVQLIS